MNEFSNALEADLDESFQNYFYVSKMDLREKNYVESLFFFTLLRRLNSL